MPPLEPRCPDCGRPSPADALCPQCEQDRTMEIESLDYRTSTDSIDTEPPSTPSTGKVTVSEEHRSASTYSSGR